MVIIVVTLLASRAVLTAVINLILLLILLITNLKRVLTTTAVVSEQDVAVPVATDSVVRQDSFALVLDQFLACCLPEDKSSDRKNKH